VGCCQVVFQKSVERAMAGIVPGLLCVYHSSTNQPMMIPVAFFVVTGLQHSHLWPAVNVRQASNTHLPPSSEKMFFGCIDVSSSI